jgi:hypothetical protein
MTPKAFGLVTCRFILRQYSCIWLVIYYFGDFDQVFLHTIKFKLEAIFIIMHLIGHFTNCFDKLKNALRF